jgi:hypothetical protein
VDTGVFIGAATGILGVIGSVILGLAGIVSFSSKKKQ